MHLVLRHASDDARAGKLPRYGGTGGRLLVDLTDKAAVGEALDADGVR